MYLSQISDHVSSFHHESVFSSGGSALAVFRTGNLNSTEIDTTGETCFKRMVSGTRQNSNDPRLDRFLGASTLWDSQQTPLPTWVAGVFLFALSRPPIAAGSCQSPPGSAGASGLRSGPTEDGVVWVDVLVGSPTRSRHRWGGVVLHIESL